MRNERYRKNAISVRERHNERKNEVYSNPDVLLEYSRNNVTFKACEAATYAQQFDRMVEEGVVSTRGLKPDAYVFDELVFDVNTDYFETHGGYEYAKQFYAKVYELAKKIAGGEQYIISAVMHADERNREASDRLGRDVFHYHLHVVYLPVVEKQIRWSKRCKDPALRGTVRETIMQVSHSKKWPMVPMTNEQGQPVLKKNGKPRLVSSYSLLQTEFFEHMRQAGFTDFERGIKGSDAEHLNVLEYKVQKDRQTVAELSDQTKQLQGKRKELISQVKNISGSIRDVADIEQRAKTKGVLEKRVELPVQDFQTLCKMAKASGKLQAQIESGLAADVFISAANKQMNALSDKGYMDKSTVKPLLENKLVLIVPKSGSEIKGFNDFGKAKHPAIGDPASVPAGQYAKEALTKLGQLDGIQSKVSLGTNVTQVLNWVAEGSADAGLVYATDAALLKDKVTVVAEAPAGSLKKPVIYPIGVLAKAPQAEAAKDFAAFLQTEEAMKIFAAYGFAQAK